MKDIELLKKYGIVEVSTISVHRCSYGKLFDETELIEKKQNETTTPFYKHYDKFKKRKK